MVKAINKHPVKLKLFIISAFLSVCISCKAQPATPTIKLQNGPALKQTEGVKYQILCSKSIYYYIGLEQLLDNQWREIIIDISSNVPDRAAIIKKLNANKPIDGTYQLKNIPAAFRKNGRIFRLRMSYGTAATAPQIVATSGEFRVD